MATAVDEALTHLARHESGRVLAMLARRFGDLDVADEAVQEAMIEASQRWPGDGVPDNAAAWLHVVARRKALDRLRRDASARRRLGAAAHELMQSEGHPSAEPVDDGGVDPGDERLRLLLLCCHPALALDAQVALTLRLVGGLTTEEIAAAFLVPTSTLAQRISRAKAKIRTAGIPMSLPDDLADRLGAVLSVLYLAFNEGYLSRSASTPKSGVQRIDLCDEAIRLASVVCGLVPQAAEPLGLSALMTLTHSRRNTRFDGDRLIVLDEQDRSRWHLDEIRSANATLEVAMRMMQPGPFQIEAVIASHHANARTPADTDWARIVALYDQLAAMRPSPVVSLNRAAALAMADGPHAGLRALERVSELDGYHLFHATRGELLGRSGDHTGAVASFERAVMLTENSAELEHLADRIRRHTLG